MPAKWRGHSTSAQTRAKARSPFNDPTDEILPSDLLLGLSLLEKCDGADDDEVLGLVVFLLCCNSVVGKSPSVDYREIADE